LLYPNSIHWNTAKYAFTDQDFALNISYIPWLRNLVGDINFSNLSGYARIDKNQTIGLSLMYFSLGNITFTDIAGERIRDYRPNEFSVDLGYALKLHENFSGGVALRYIRSNLTGGISQSSTPTHPGNAVSGDISAFYTNDIEVSGRKSNLSAGLNISNLGTTISYSDDAYQEFLPANLRIGAAFTVELDSYNTIMVSADLNKLLVPTPPLLGPDTTADGELVVHGEMPEDAVAAAVFQSFGDAPAGTKEELREIMYSAGMEYWYNKQFALRAGYFHEHETKGNRKYFTFAYLVPAAGRQNPLANTLRFTLGFNFKGLKNEGKDNE